MKVVVSSDTVEELEQPFFSQENTECVYLPTVSAIYELWTQKTY